MLERELALLIRLEVASRAGGGETVAPNEQFECPIGEERVARYVEHLEVRGELHDTVEYLIVEVAKSRGAQFSQMGVGSAALEFKSDRERKAPEKGGIDLATGTEVDLLYISCCALNNDDRRAVDVLEPMKVNLGQSRRPFEEVMERGRGE